MSITFLTTKDRRKKTDLLIIGFFENGNVSRELKNYEPQFSEAAAYALQQNRFAGKSGQTFSSYCPNFQEAPEVLLIGLGSKKSYSLKVLRKTLGGALQSARKVKAKKVRIVLDSFLAGDVNASVMAGLSAELLVLGAYQFDRHKKTKSESTKLSVEFLSTKKVGAGVEKQVQWHDAVARGTCLTRDLINEPANVMDSNQMMAEAKKMCAKRKMTCKILNEAELKRLKMNGILCVNQGSDKPPALVIFEHGKQYQKKGTTCLVGKGVTFDTGGLSIKPPKGMEKMKYDMSGAAAVYGAMQAISDLNIPKHVIGMTPLVENNVSADPQRPGDIIKMFNGKTVEVLNTDAEGRLILADALSYSEKFKPKAIIDLATLTGMCAYTFADQAIAIMGNNDKLIERVKKAGDSSGQRCWELPMWEEYGDQIKGSHSDLCNIGGTYGGTITAAKFLEEFVPEGRAWVHLDIAGTAWTESNRYDCPRGATGVGVKLLTQLLSS